jgi:hypothetical protein
VTDDGDQATARAEAMQEGDRAPLPEEGGPDAETNETFGGVLDVSYEWLADALNFPRGVKIVGTLGGMNRRVLRMAVETNRTGSGLPTVPDGSEYPRVTLVGKHIEAEFHELPF